MHACMTLVPFQKKQSQAIYAIISSFLRSVTLALLIHGKGIVRRNRERNHT
jgi:hypothetical protein